jgi:hypothetical protein
LRGYTAIEGLDAAEVWLSFSDDEVNRIIEEYEVMTYSQDCEQEYASFATETFLLQIGSGVLRGCSSYLFGSLARIPIG